MTKAKGVEFEPRNTAQRRYHQQLKSHDLVFGIGPAGTGKTFVAAHYGASLLASGALDRYVIVRSMVAVEDEEMGHLPGGIDEKIAPWARPVLTEMYKAAGKDVVRRWIGEGRVEAVPIGYIRGLTFDRSFIHVCEAQNLTRSQAYAIVTRDGDGSRMVVEGDPDQVDYGGFLPELVRLAPQPKAVTRFKSEDIVRSPKVRAWVEAFAQ